jgi:hypothetical protein
MEAVNPFYSSRTRADLARELGWQPQKTEEDFKKHFLEEAQLIMRESEASGM